MYTPIDSPYMYINLNILISESKLQNSELELNDSKKIIKNYFRVVRILNYVHMQ